MNSLEETIAEANILVSNKEKMLFEKFLKEIDYSDTFAYNHHIGESLTIFCKHPGIWIGKCGKNVAILKQLFEKEFCYKKEYKIEFKEITGNFITINTNV